MRHIQSNPVFGGSDQERHKPACTTTGGKNISRVTVAKLYKCNIVASDVTMQVRHSCNKNI